MRLKGFKTLWDVDVEDKIVLIRFDHNVVKKGIIKDPFRIEQSIGTLFHIVARGGKPILMTHIGRPRDSEGKININRDTSVEPIVDYLRSRLNIKVFTPKIDPNLNGIPHIPEMEDAIHKLKKGNIQTIYLPNTRWFKGEESKIEEERKKLSREMASISDMYVNDAFGSWQPHVSTYDVSFSLPSYFGFLMAKELESLQGLLNPERPFLAVVAGAKYDTKIGPLRELLPKVDHLILGGIIYNTYLAAKYDLKLPGITEKNMARAKELLDLDRDGKIIELPYLLGIEDINNAGKEPARPFSIKDLASSDPYLIDIDPRSIEDIEDIIMNARTIFVNAVMGYTPFYPEGSRMLYRIISKNSKGRKFMAGGDTLQEFKSLCAGEYIEALRREDFYLFTGGGAVLKALELGPENMPTVKAILDKK